MELYGEDGSIERICTDPGWDWSDDGPIRFADNKDGEIIESGRVPSYAGKALKVRNKVVPTASDNVPVTEHEKFCDPHLIITPEGKKVLDFGQNIAGYVSFEINAHDGQKLLLRFGEMLDKDGEFTQKNIQCANKKTYQGHAVAASRLHLQRRNQPL